MNRHLLQTLQQASGYPALTITMPTHRTSPENKQDPIRLRNLVDQASDRLLREFGKRDIGPLLDRLVDLAGSIDLRYALDGLALFVSKDVAEAVRLPVTLQERVVVDETFYTRDLVFALNRSPRYWVLALSEKPTRLFEGLRDLLTEVRTGGFPLVHEGPGGEQRLPGGQGVRTSAYRDEYHRQFFRQVDANLKPFMAADPLPLAVVGVDRFLAFFQEVTDHREAIITTLTGSHDRTPPHELAALVWPLVQANLALRRQQVLDDLERAVSAGKSASTVGEVWRMAREGRGGTLVVEENYHYPATVADDGRLRPAEDATAPGAMDDAVDEIIETVLRMQGRVVFADDGALAAHGRIALILRY